MKTFKLHSKADKYTTQTITAKNEKEALSKANKYPGAPFKVEKQINTDSKLYKAQAESNRRAICTIH